MPKAKPTSVSKKGKSYMKTPLTKNKPDLPSELLAAIKNAMKISMGELVHQLIEKLDKTHQPASSNKNPGVMLVHMVRLAWLVWTQMTIPLEMNHTVKDRQD
jgi:hypothetical protein